MRAAPPNSAATPATATCCVTAGPAALSLLVEVEVDSIPDADAEAAVASELFAVVVVASAALSLSAPAVTSTLAVLVKKPSIHCLVFHVSVFVVEVPCTYAVDCPVHQAVSFLLYKLQSIL